MILVNNPGDRNHVYPPLLHAKWHGWTFTDMVFPFFLWISGVAMTLSFARRVERGDDRGRLLLHTARRAAIIFGLGLLLNGFPRYDFATLRIPGVLQRIAVCYFIAAAIYLYTDRRGQVLATAGLLGGYWILMAWVPVPGYGPGVLEVQGNLAGWVDGLVLSGHMWSATRTWDPEGILSTIPAIATVLFGILAGRLLRAPWPGARKTGAMLAAGLALLIGGLLVDRWFPINKNLWTSSFALLMAGWAMIVYGLCYWLIDVKQYRRWARPFAILGTNALALYVLSIGLARLLGTLEVTGPAGEQLTLKAALFNTVFAPLAAPVNASVLYAVSNVLAIYLVAWVMYRRGWFVKV